MEDENSDMFVNDEDSSRVIEVNEEDSMMGVDDMDLNEERNNSNERDNDDGEEGEESELNLIEPERDDAVLVFDKHKDEVFVVKVGGNEVAASGGKDDTAYVFNINTGEMLFECSGHKESVESVCFNHNNTYLATGDLDGCIKVWSLKDATEIWTFDIAEIQWMTWHPKAPLLLAGDTEGNVWLWNIPYSHSKTLPSNGHACICGSFLPDGKRAVCGYEDGSLRIWDLKSITTIHNFPPSPQHHRSSILTLDCHHGNSLVASGGADGSVMIVNSVSGQVMKLFSISSQKNSSSQEEDGDDNCVETLAFSPSLPYLAIGSGSGDLIIWDINKTSPRFSLSNCHQGNLIKVIWHPNTQHVLFSSSVDGEVMWWDVRSGERLGSFLGHRSAILGTAITPDGSKILTASADKTVRVYSTVPPNN